MEEQAVPPWAQHNAATGPTTPTQAKPAEKSHACPWSSRVLSYHPISATTVPSTRNVARFHLSSKYHLHQSTSQPCMVHDVFQPCRASECHFRSHVAVTPVGSPRTGPSLPTLSTDQGPHTRRANECLCTSEHKTEDRNQTWCSIECGWGSLQRGPSLKKKGMLPRPPSWKMVGCLDPLSASVVRNDISYLQHLLRPAEDAFLHLVLHIWHKMTTFA